MIEPIASVRPRPPRTSVKDAAVCLGDLCGFGSHVDAFCILQRVEALARAGENATSIMARLNPPARVVPLPAKFEADDFGREATPAEEYRAGLQRLWCRVCRRDWSRQRAPGRAPSVCPNCKARG